LRFQAITVTRTRFDGWALAWETGFETEGAARAAGERWRERKEKRGYRAVIVCREKGHADHD
jgi:hypothetical protein